MGKLGEMLRFLLKAGQKDLCHVLCATIGLPSLRTHAICDHATGSAKVTPFLTVVQPQSSGEQWPSRSAIASRPVSPALSGPISGFEGADRGVCGIAIDGFFSLRSNGCRKANPGVFMKICLLKRPQAFFPPH